MKINKDPDKTLNFNPDKCSKLYEDLINVFRKHKPTVGEIIIALGNLMYTIGASIEGYNKTGPGLEEVQKLYYSNPERIGIALMAQGLLTTTWYEDWEKLQLDMEDKLQPDKENKEDKKEK